MDDLRILTGKVCDVARTAGRFLKEERKSFRREAVEEKHAHDYVSYVDKESEKRVVAALGALLPEAGFIVEEGSAVYRDEPYCWVVDPLDGTTNYIHGNAPYCGGAYLNGQSLQVSSVRSMEASFVVTELPYNSEQYARTGEYLIRELYGRVAGIRMNGSAAIALCYVAAGRFDAWLEAFLGKWDFSAAALIVQEAGGRVTDFYGNAGFIDGHHVVATNGWLHPFLLELVQKAMPLGM